MKFLLMQAKLKKLAFQLKKPEGTETLEWKNLEIYPGLISPGSSLGLVEINALRPTRDEREAGTHTPEIEAWTAVNPDSELIPVARANGITHSVIVPLGGLISGTSSLITLDGWGIEEISKSQKGSSSSLVARTNHCSQLFSKKRIMLKSNHFPNRTKTEKNQLMKLMNLLLRQSIISKLKRQKIKIFNITLAGKP